MDISEVAKRSGLATSTLRFYEEKGLIRSIGRRAQRRVFDLRVLDQLAIIALGRAAGFSLHEIGGMLHADGKTHIDRQALMAKAEEIDRSIKQMKAVRDGLRHAADCPEKSHLDCPTFRRLMRAANAGEIRPLLEKVSRA
ncbi:helix-turn-helix domain-containing protein [Allopusillimonas ginsengisoli]|uniref:helix-turn-helix domain-containing protein n=1 Tax=Allopusillimonas ginsengisoli TaxID=453575 RepID=UPI00102279E1|nr:helix-turn-helix domain-containing protein [Allopusillimonas ginsengisoli]TEA77012.1 MerR family transcriptional regulator [Allopusillimonas ginsengisoli]